MYIYIHRIYIYIHRIYIYILYTEILYKWYIYIYMYIYIYAHNCCVFSIFLQCLSWTRKFSQHNQLCHTAPARIAGFGQWLWLGCDSIFPSHCESGGALCHLSTAGMSGKTWEIGIPRTIGAAESPWMERRLWHLHLQAQNFVCLTGFLGE